jgi:hypothetical protein
MIYLWWYIIKSLLNDETMMKCLIENLDDCRNDYEMLIDLDECWNNDENINVLKWPVW